MKACFLVEWQRQGNQLFINFNLANCLTIARIIFSICLVVLAVAGVVKPWLMLLLVVLCGATDLFDGRIARKYEIKTENGAKLDRLADKMFIASAIIIFYFCFWPLVDIDPGMKHLTEVLGKAVLIFEVFLMASGIYGLIKGLNVSANEWGRRKMFFESVAVIGLYLGVVVEYLNVKFFYSMIYLIDVILALAGILAILSMVGYILCWSVIKIKTDG